MKLSFEWEEEKAEANLKKHRTGFDEAQQCSWTPIH